jgi:hypothetical protein
VRSFIVAACFGLGALASSSTAHADITSWLALGAGGGMQRSDVSGNVDAAPNFTASVGVGSSPNPPVIVGGVFRALVNFGLGTDISVSARIASRGFVRGGFGLAFDVGPAYRYWRGGDYGTYPIQGVLTIGLPAGLQVGLGGHFWSLDANNSALGGFAVVEIDLLRLTLMRKDNLEQYWPNPSAAGDIK